MNLLTKKLDDCYEVSIIDDKVVRIQNSLVSVIKGSFSKTVSLKFYIILKFGTLMFYRTELVSQNVQKLAKNWDLGQ